MSTLDSEPAPAALAVNDIGEIKLRAARPLVFDGYATNRLTGSFILIEPGTNATVAAGMLRAPHDEFKPETADYVI
jgi:sulfate adenylyltransferase subunit 1